MSDVSGIPYMGPMGQGNFFAPQFPSNPQINPTAGYAAPAAYSQGVFDNTIRNLEYDQRLFQHYYEQSLRGVANIGAPAPPGKYGSGEGQLDPGGSQGLGYSGFRAPWDMPSGRSGGAGPPLASPYQTTPNVFDTGASPFWGGGGSSGMGGSMFGGLGGGNPPAIDWSKVGQAAGNLYGGKQDPYPGMSMPGGLNSPMTAPSQAGALDWSKIQSPATDYNTFQGGGPRADPYPDMAMPGGLNSPMTTPALEWPQGPAKAQEQPAFDFTGANAGWGNAPGAMPSSKSALGYEPREFPTQDTKAAPDRGLDPNYWTDMLGGQSPATGYDTFQGGWGNVSGDKPQGPESALTPGGGLTAAELGVQARERLAELMRSESGESGRGSYTRASQDLAPESTAGDYHRASQDLYPTELQDVSAFKTGETVPVPRERPAGADAVARLPGDVDNSLAGRRAALDTLKKELSALDLHMTSSYRDPSDPLSRQNPRSAHTQGLAFDTRAHTTEQGDRVMGQIRELFGARGLVEGRDYKILDEVRRPSGHATAPHIHTALTPEGMERYQRDAYGTYQPTTPPRPPADIPFPEGVPTPRERPAEAPAAEPSALQSPATSYGSFQQPSATSAATNVYPGAAAPRPPADIPAVTKHSGLELARANIDTPIEKIAMERGGQKAVDQISSMAVGMTPRQLQQAYGSLFMSRAEPMFQSLGITRQDFEKAASMPPARQDLKMRFAEGQFGPYPEYTGPEAAPGTQQFNPAANVWETQPNTWADFRQSTNVEDRRGLPSEPRGVLDPVTDWTSRMWDYYGPQADPGQLGRDLGIENLPARGQLAGLQSAAALSPSPAPTFEELWKDRGLPSGTADVQSPATDYDTFQQGRSDLAAQIAAPRATMDFSGFSRTPEPSQRAAPGGVGPEMEPPTPEFMQTVAQTESGFDPNKHNPGSQYKGMYQLNEEEFRKYGGTGSIYDQDQNSMAVMKKMIAEGQTAQNILGRALTPVEQYMVHQQGLYGTLSHLQNPDQPAWKSFQQVSKWSDEKAKTAIWDNLTKDMKAQVGKVENITSRDFIDMWTTKMLQKQVESGQPGGSILP